MKPAHPSYSLELIYTAHPVPREVAWYKWEFLRRNPQYQADYKEFEAKFGSWLHRRGYWYDYDRRATNWTKSDEAYFYNNIAPTIYTICRKWQIGNLFPPDWKFHRKHGIRRLGSRELGPPTAIAPELNWDFRYMVDLFDKGFVGTADSARRYRNLISVEFDLDRPMKDLLKYAKYVLTRAKENYEDELQEHDLRAPSGRRRFDDYDSHLKVWDLNIDGNTMEDIARLVFPHDHTASVLQKVRDHIKSAQSLISGHYKEIR